MKKTIVKVLTAALVLTTLVCSAAGCGKSNTAGGTSETSVTSEVSAQASEEKQSSQIEIVESKTDVEIRNIDLKTITQDKIKAAYTGDDTTGQYTGLVLMLDDGKEGDLCVMYIVAKADGNPTAAGVMNGTVTESSDKDEADGPKTKVFTVVEPTGMRDTMTQTTSADGKEISMSFAGGPYVLKLTAIDSAEAFAKYQETDKIFESFAAGADRTTEETDAATMDAACKNYYAGIVSGTINAENNEYVKSDTLPAASATIAERKEAALKCTVKGAMECYGLDNANFDLSGLRADEVGTIFYKEDNTRIAAVETITENTTFEELGYGK